MNGAGACQRDVAKDGKHFIEISESDAAPGRGADEMKRVAKDRPAQVGGHAGIAGAKVKALESLAAEKQHHGEQNQEHGDAEGDTRGRAFAQGKRAQPKSAPGHEKQNAGS